MGYSSQSGQVVLRSQPTPGVFAADLGTAGVGVKLRGGSLGTSRELLIPDAEIGGGRDVVDGYLGAVSWSGDYEFYARMDSLATLLRACLGNATSTPDVGAEFSTHTITPTDSGSLPYLSIEEAIAGDLEIFNYHDAVVNTFHLEAEANGYLQGTAGVIAKRQVAGATKTATPVWDNTPMIVGTNIFVTYNGVTLPAKNFSLDINNNVEDDDFRLGSFYIGDLTAKRREITASFGIRAESSALWRQATYGLDTATAPSGVPQKKELKITMSTYEMIGASAQPYSLELTIPKFVLSPFTLEVSGDDILENDIEGQAIRPDTAVGIMSADITSGKAEIA